MPPTSRVTASTPAEAIHPLPASSSSPTAGSNRQLHQFKPGDRVVDLVTNLTPVPRGYRRTQAIDEVDGRSAAIPHPKDPAARLGATTMAPQHTRTRRTAEKGKKPESAPERMMTDALKLFVENDMGDHLRLIYLPDLVMKPLRKLSI